MNSQQKYLDSLDNSGELLVKALGGNFDNSDVRSDIEEYHAKWDGLVEVCLIDIILRIT